MFRPPDTASKGVIELDGDKLKLQLNVNQIQFLNDSAKITWFFGIKNDSRRTGFEVVLPRGSICKLDPVKMLED